MGIEQKMALTAFTIPVISTFIAIFLSKQILKLIIYIKIKIL